MEYEPYIPMTPMLTPMTKSMTDLMTPPQVERATDEPLAPRTEPVNKQRSCRPARVRHNTTTKTRYQTPLLPAGDISPTA